MITVNFYSIADFSKLEDQWKKIENGVDMTSFQSYEWYKEINNQYSNHAYSIPGKPLYAVASENGNATMIAPLFIIKLPKITERFNLQSGAYILGKWGHTDYLNFIYSKFSPDAFDLILKSVKEKYKVSQFLIHQILPNTEIRKYIDSTYPKALQFEGECVKIEPKESFDLYYKELSKSFRQNIRTANNRAAKDGFEITYSVKRNVSADEANRLYEIYTQRSIVKNSGKPEPFYATLMDNIRNKAIKKYNYITHGMQYLDNGFIMLFKVNDETAGFCFGLENNSSIYIPIVSITEKYIRYSPGVVCIFNFLKDSYENGSIKTFDLLKGSEKYKLSLGGTLVNIGYYNITL